MATTTTADADVVIIGAGPGGASAAVALAQRGVHRVILLDRDEFPRDKTCGSGLSPNAFVLADELGIGDQVRRLSTPIEALKVVTPGGHSMLLRSGASAAVLLRKDFDNLIVERARSLGVELRTKFLAKELIRDGERVVGVRSRDGQEVRGRFVICADGAHSIFSIDPRPKRTIATLMGWWEDFPNDQGTAEMIFDKNVAPLYGWMFPESPTRVNIGICIDGEDERGNKTQRNVREVFQQFLDDHYKDRIAKARQVGRLKGHPISWTTWVGHMTVPGALYLGEAARVTHNATGEGISQAMQSGVYAAEAIESVLAGRETEARAWKRYEWTHRKRFTTGFVVGHVLRRVIDSPVLDYLARAYNSPRVRAGVVRVLGSAMAGSTVQAREAGTAGAAGERAKAQDGAGVVAAP